MNEIVTGTELCIDQRYERALEELARTISGKNRNLAGSVTWEEQFERLHEYIDVLPGIRDRLESEMRVIHVAGTKGKGSTCAFAEAILIECVVQNVGLFTSPHLVDVRERFRVNGKPITKEVFCDSIDWLMENIERNKLEVPAYFRFLFLLALKIFSDANVECLILEVGLGGRLDATNVVRKPIVCGITSLGLDHVEVLGHTIDLIATEKAGIMKDFVKAYTSPQPALAMDSLKKKANSLQNCELISAKQLDLKLKNGEPVQLGLSGPHQRINASLAVALVKEWAEKTNHKGMLDVLQMKNNENDDLLQQHDELPLAFRRGLAKTTWPGREQIVQDEFSKNLTFYLDGAHTEESMKSSAEWFSAHVNAKRKKEIKNNNNSGGGNAQREGDDKIHNVFLFNCMEERSPLMLLSASFDVLKSKNVIIDCAMFCPPDSSVLGLVKVEDDKKNLEWQETCAKTWREINNNNNNNNNSANSSSSSLNEVQTDVRASVAGAISALRRKADLVAPKRVDVLVAGSLYLVGDILRQLKKLGVK